MFVNLPHAGRGLAEGQTVVDARQGRETTVRPETQSSVVGGTRGSSQQLYLASSWGRTGDLVIDEEYERKQLVGPGELALNSRNLSASLPNSGDGDPLTPTPSKSHCPPQHDQYKYAVKTFEA